MEYGYLPNMISTTELKEFYYNLLSHTRISPVSCFTLLNCSGMHVHARFVFVRTLDIEGSPKRPTFNNSMSVTNPDKDCRIRFSNTQLKGQKIRYFSANVKNDTRKFHIKMSPLAPQVLSRANGWLEASIFYVTSYLCRPRKHVSEVRTICLLIEWRSHC